jgi:transposase
MRARIRAHLTYANQQLTGQDIKDKVDARVLAELCRRELVPAVWVPSLEDRAIRERLRRRMHLVKLRTSHRNRIGRSGASTTSGRRDLDQLRRG